MSAVTSRAPGWLLPVALVLVGTLALVAIGRDSSSDEPLDPRSHDRLGTSASVALARELGAEVDVTDALPGDDTDVYLVLVDLFDEDQRDELDSWVSDGGTAIIVDPASESTPPYGQSFTDGGSLAQQVGPTACDIDAFAGIDIDDVEPSGSGVLYDVPGGARSCIGGRNQAYVVAQSRGQGALVSVGGSGVFVNEGLGTGDNAAVVGALLAPSPGARVEVLRPGPTAGGGGQRGLLDLIAPNVWAFLAQLALAFLLLAFWRSRRLGAPVAEPQPVAVAGSELVAAVGSLLECRPRGSVLAGEVDRRVGEVHRHELVHLRGVALQRVGALLQDPVRAVVQDHEGHRDLVVRGAPQRLDRVHRRAVAADADQRPVRPGL